MYIFNKYIALLLLTLVGCTTPGDLAKPKAVKLIGAGICSGVQIEAPSGKQYILTAAHCRVLSGSKNSMTVMTQDGVISEHAIIAESELSDLLLLEGLPNRPGIRVAERSYSGEHVSTFTNGSGLPTYKTEGILIGTRMLEIPIGLVDSNLPCISPKYLKMPFMAGTEVVEECLLYLKEMVSTALVVPGSSGGMVVDDMGNLVGIVSARDNYFGYFITLDDIQKFLAGY